MSHFLLKWDEERVFARYYADLEKLTVSDSPLISLWSNHLKRVTAGDHLWIICVIDGEIFLSGHLLVDKVLNPNKAKQRQGASDLHPDKYNAVSLSENAELMQSRCLTEVAAYLRFLSSSGKDRLRFKEDGKLVPQQLRTMRELTPESADILEGIWYDDEDEEAENILPEIKEQFADLEHRLEVEAASVAFAIAQLESEGWQVESVEAQKIGYDLHCMQGDRSLHVEVKGTSGEDQLFIITANELTQAKSDSEFVLFLVTKALESNPSLHCFTGQELVASFSFDPLQYRASKRA